MKTKYLDFLNENKVSVTLDIDSPMPYTKILEVYDAAINNSMLNNLNTYNFPNLSNIEFINCIIDDKIYNIDFSQFANLNIITIVDCKLTKSIQTKNCKKLTQVNLSRNNLENVDLSMIPTQIKTLSMVGCNLNEIDLKPFYQLNSVDLTGNNIKEIFIPKSVQNFTIKFNPIAKLPDIDNSYDLKYLGISNTNIDSLSNINKRLLLDYLDTKLKTYFDVSRINPIKYEKLDSVPKPEKHWYANFYGFYKDKHKQYWESLFNYCVGNNSLYEDFMEIEWPEDFYDNYISKVTTPTQKKYIGYLKHKKDFDNLNVDLFNYD